MEHSKRFEKIKLHNTSMAMKSETNFDCSHSAKSIVTNNMVDKANEINNKIHPFIIHGDKIKL